MTTVFDGVHPLEYKDHCVCFTYEGYTEQFRQAGYDANAVQNKVNQMVNSKSIDTVAREVIQGKWGNGAERKRRLTQAGYDFNVVQNRVNALL